MEDVTIDSLAYVDKELDHPTIRSSVEQLVQEEMGRFRPKNYLEHLPAPTLDFNGSKFLQKEYERVSKQGAAAELPADVQLPSAPEGSASASQWEKAIDEAKVAIEYEKGRMINLELMNKFGVDEWKYYNEQRDGQKQSLKRKADESRRRMDEINRERQAIQSTHGPKLKTLAKRWAETMAKNQQIEIACAQAEQEVKRLKSIAKERGVLPEDMQDESMA